MTLLLPAMKTVLPSTLAAMTGSAPTVSGSVYGEPISWKKPWPTANVSWRY